MRRKETYMKTFDKVVKGIQAGCYLILFILSTILFVHSLVSKEPYRR